MTTPDGIRSESTRTPNASRAGALHSHIQSHLHAIHAPRLTSGFGSNSLPVDNATDATTRDRLAWMALREIGGGW